MDCLAGGESVANLEIARVGDADDVAGVSLVDNALLLRHEGCRSGKTHELARADVAVVDIALELARAYLDKGKA